MSNNVFGDTSWVNEEEAVSVLPSTIQWRRGDLTNVNPLLKNGCWQFPMEHFASIAPPVWEPVDVLHSGGETVTSFLQEKIHLAIVGYRKRWFYKVEDKKVYLPANFVNDGKKISSTLQIWAICKELDNEPVLVSVSGLNSKAMEEAMNVFIKQIVTGASRLAKTRFARYHFWLPLVTSPKQVTKEKTYVTPPQIAMTIPVSNEFLRSLFTGKDVALLAEAELPACKEWATFKAEAAAGNGHDEGPANFRDELAPDFFAEEEPLFQE